MSDEETGRTEARAATARSGARRDGHGAEVRVGAQVADRVGPGNGAVRVTLLIDNERGAPGLRAQWGLAMWVETREARVLLDSGANDAFWRNALKLGVPVEKADAFVLSHGHSDHGGGLAKVLEVAPAAGIVLHPAAFAPRMWLARTGKVEPIGLPARALTALWSAPGRIVSALGPLEVAPGVWASGPIPRRHPLEEAERNFFLDPACTVRDHVVDDQAVWTAAASGLVVLLGCAHAGVVNTLDHVRRVAAGAQAAGADALSLGGDGLPLAGDGLPRVTAVIGGMHLLHASPARLQATGDALEAAGVRLVASVHCTGKRGKGYLRERFGGTYADAATGSVFEID
ncbi:MAG: MBL fold metallo-hydrolase [Thermoleophilia bacterium]|nr:MBL fold metallo-hydrolase [Thermoleophilia bacterium]